MFPSGTVHSNEPDRFGDHLTERSHAARGLPATKGDPAFTFLHNDAVNSEPAGPRPKGVLPGRSRDSLLVSGN